jgi:hypothetical protein
MLHPMGDMLKLIWWTVSGLFRSRVSLEAEFPTLRHQLNVLQRKSPKRRMHPVCPGAQIFHGADVQAAAADAWLIGFSPDIIRLLLRHRSRGASVVLRGKEDYDEWSRL